MLEMGKKLLMMLAKGFGWAVALCAILQGMHYIHGPVSLPKVDHQAQVAVVKQDLHASALTGSSLKQQHVEQRQWLNHP